MASFTYGEQQILKDERAVLLGPVTPTAVKESPSDAK
jgi:hypothetical protein